MKTKLYYITLFTFLIFGVVYAAQVAIVQTDTRNQAWTKETNNNSDLQTNIDLKANITSASLITPDIGVATGTSLNLSGGLIAVGNVQAGPSANPAVVLSDSDGAGTDKFSGAVRSNMTTTTDGAEVSDTWVTYMDAGTETTAISIDGSANILDFNIPISAKTLTPVTGDADDFASTFTGRNLYGGTYIINATGTAQLPQMGPGMNFKIVTAGAILAVVNAHVDDGFLADGVTAVEGSDLTNLSTAGDMMTVESYTTDDWLIMTNGWTP